MFERKKLGILQPNLQGKLSYQGGKIVLESPTSRKRKNDENQTPLKPARKDGIYEDPVTPLTKRAKRCPVSGVDAAVQTEQIVLAPSVTRLLSCGSEKSMVIASTSSNNDVSSSNHAAPKVEEQGAMAATPCREGKPASKADEFQTPIDKGLPSISKATESGMKERVAAQLNTSCVLLSEKRRKSKIAQAEIDMLTKDVPGEKYWEMVAAERKAALTAALAENRQLYERNTELQDRVHYLERENTLLEDWLKESKQMAELLASVTDQDDIPEQDEEKTTPGTEATDAKLVEEDDKPLAEPLPSN